MSLAIFRLASTLLLSVLSAQSFAADDAWLMLQKTAYAARELNYQGVFAYQNGKQTRSVQITHMNRDGQEMTRNLVLDASLQAKQPREVFSQGNDILIVSPKNESNNTSTVVIEKRRGQNLFPAMLPTDLQALKTSYTTRVLATEMVAGRGTQVIELIANDSYRYSYKIWADAEFGLLLKMTLLDSNKQTVEQIEFTQLSMLNSRDVNWFQPKIDVKKNYVTDISTPVSHVDTNWIVAELPTGYVKVDHVILNLPGKSTPVDQMIFSDGIASVSLFIEPISKAVRPKTGHMVIGSTNICANVTDGYQITVVGEVPAATVLQIAKAVTFKKQTASK
ncbi:MAG: MucB/RseB C-terminal domain-containing protein [Bdellovibrio sp.]|nr:MucB/RseB C-terminal domain-containing protein [Methylotenera sp.]